MLVEKAFKAFGCKISSKHFKNKCKVYKHKTKNVFLVLFVDFQISNLIKKEKLKTNHYFFLRLPNYSDNKRWLSALGGKTFLARSIHPSRG